MLWASVRLHAQLTTSAPGSPPAKSNHRRWCRSPNECPAFPTTRSIGRPHCPECSRRRKDGVEHLMTA